MKNFFEFDQDDKKLWLGLSIAAIVYVIAFSLFWGGIGNQIERALFFLLEDILPGFLIVKLFLDKVTVSDYRIADKLMLSFGISLISLVIPFFFLKYFRTYESNTDEKSWGLVSDTTITVILLILVITTAFAVKYYQNKKKGIA